MAMNEKAHYRYLRPEDILRLKNYEFGARAMVEGYLSGRHRSRQRGASIEFHEYRQYAPGDDPALVDWRVYARSDRHYLRTFELETNMECHIFLDSSASMGFGGTGGAGLSKLDYASFFAACLAWLVVSKTDRVSLHLFDDKIRSSFPPGSTRRHLHALLTTLENNRPGNPTALGTALEMAAPLIKRKGTLVVLSDFFDDPARIFAALNRFLHRGFRVHLFHVLDPREIDLPDVKLSRFVDMETGEQLVVHAPAVREAWRENLRAHQRALRKFASSRQVDYAVAPTSQSYYSLFDRLS